MNPLELRDVLAAGLPTLPGVASATAWPDRPYGLEVTLAEGGCVYWMVTGASAVAPPANPEERLEPQPLPNLSGGQVPVAAVEQALLATLATVAGEQIARADRYSTRPAPPAVGYGATIDCTDGWRIFIAAVGTSARPGERLRPVASDSTV